MGTPGTRLGATITRLGCVGLGSLTLWSCSGAEENPSNGDGAGAAGSSHAGASGNESGAAGASGPSAGADAGGSGGLASAGSGGSPALGGSGGSGGALAEPTYCDRWRALAAGELPGFATSSECNEYDTLEVGDAPCSGANNPSAQIARIELAQNHVLTPTSEDYTENDSGNPLNENARRPKFRLVSHRAALLLVSVTGEGAAPEVKVSATRNGSPLGSYCLSGPAALSATPPLAPGQGTHFTVSLPAEWIRSGLELTVEAGEDARQLPADTLRVAGGVRHIVMEVPMRLYGDTESPVVPKDRPKPYVMGDELPVQSLVWAHFPVPVVMDPMVMSARGGNPARVVHAHEGSFDEVGEVLDLVAEIRRANGHTDETAYFGAMRSGGAQGWGGGLGGGNGSSGPASQLMIRHESGHAYGLPHMEDAYAQGRYPFAKRSDGSGCVLGVPGEDGCGVGPYWKFYQSRGSFQSPWMDGSSTVYRRDPMAGGGDEWFGAYTDQWVLDYMRQRVHWDDLAEKYVRYDAASGEFVEDVPADDNWYGRAAARDVPVWTIFGTYSSSVSEVNVIQPPLHYRGHLRRVMDPTESEGLDWLREHPGRICGSGCDLVLKLFFVGGLEKHVLLRHGAGNYVRWAVNVPDLGQLLRAELYRRDLSNGGGGNINAASAATFMAAATQVVARDF